MIVNRFLENLKRKGIIDNDNLEFIRYGLYQLANYILFWICQIILYLFFGHLWDGILFLVAFIFLRRYSGGYHANTRIRCFIYSNLVSLSYIGFCNLQSIYNNALLTLLFVASIVVILILSPIDNENKRLDEKEKIKYKSKVTKIIMIDILSVIFFKYIGMEKIYNILICSVTIASVLVLLGYLKDKKRKIYTK